MRVGLTGGIGSGKTTVGRRFAELGALLIDTDELAREAIAPGSEGLRKVLARWPEVRARDGAVDRAALADIVFRDAAARAELNAIVHPIVRRLAALKEAAASREGIVVHEVPLLFESGYDGMCDATVLVLADEAARVARVVARSGLSADEITRRINAQIGPEAARSKATFVIENDGTLAELRRKTDEVWRRLSSAA